jgi:polyhydroxybutyrate depolymerase
MTRSLSAIFVSSFFIGCSPIVPVNEMDASVPDSGNSNGSDAGMVDAGPVDSGIDSGIFDAGFDAGIDAGFDAGVDAGIPRDGGLNMRPFRLVVPAAYTGTTDVPFMILLHGYTFSGIGQDVYFRLSQLAEDQNFLLATPDGLRDNAGQQFWNATDACCNWTKVPVDDVAYVDEIIANVKSRYRVDAKRIYVVGHSNGAFMAHRYACERAEKIAGIVALAGMNYADSAKCQPKEKVAILHVHGTLDTVISYTGGVALAGNPPFPSVNDSMSTWATKNGCAQTRTQKANLNIDTPLLGDETRVYSYDGCNGLVEHWQILAGSHVPAFNTDWAPSFYNFLKAHPKP